MQEWREREKPESGDAPPGLAPELVLDVRWLDGGEFLGVIARDILAWEDVTHWRISGVSPNEAGARAASFVEEARVRLLRRPEREPEDPRERVTARLRKMMNKVRERQASSSTTILEALRRVTGISVGRPQEADPEIDEWRQLVRDTPEMMRWARLVAGNVSISIAGSTGGGQEAVEQARVHAAALMTGDLDIDPYVEGVLNALAVLLRDDTDFSKFRREKLVDRPPRVNATLHELEQQARARVKVVKMQPGDLVYPESAPETRH